ncbi:MAG: outer membrane protein assembly factor BamA [Myxococcales bacterium]|nr:outer membrane protein assembly factor BamA [Myxococcales bacterium]
MDIRFRGNRKVEDAAIISALITKKGKNYSPARLSADVRAIWAMGYFEDVKVLAGPVPGGVVLVYVVKEKPSVRKIIVGGNDEVDLDKINEVLDLKRNGILNVAKIKRNVGKIRDLYTEKGFYLAEVSYRLRRVSAAEVDIIFDIKENAKVIIRRITFIGNKAIDAPTLKSSIGTQEGGFFSFLTSSGTYQETAFERDLLIITSLYYDRGFINVKLSSPQIVLSPDKRFMYITIHIKEGLKYKIGKVDVKGTLLWPKKELLDLINTEGGQIFNRTRLGKDVIRLTNKYKDKGYAYANVTPLTSIDANRRIVDLTFEFQKGPVVIFERINIRGNSKTRDKVIRRELRVNEGDRYSQSRLDLSRRRVTALGYFESVNISTRRGTKDNRIIVNVEVKERPTGTFQIGAGFSSVENFIAQAQISQNNLFGRGQRLALQAQISGLRQLFSLSFSEPYFLDTRWTFGFDIYNSLRAFNSFNRNATGGQLVFGYPITYNIRVFVTYKGEYVDVSTQGNASFLGSGLATPVPAGVRIANLFNDGFTSSVRFSIQWDRRNNRLFPSKGFFHAAWAEFATNVLGSQNIFNKYGAFARFYYPLWGPFIFKTNLQVGLITSSASQGVPIFERYFVGGILNVRGFRPRSLGPTIPVLSKQDPNADLFAFNKGGNKQLIFNAEIEFPIFAKVGIRGVVFTDAGNAFDDNESISISGLRHSWGFGFRWFSPIGPLRFEWGLPFSPNPGEDPIVFEFTIGNFF